MKTTIKTGKYEVVKSDVFYMDHPESEVMIHLVIENVLVGDIKINFITIQHMQGCEMEADVVDGELIIKCINFNDALGTGTIMPIEVGYAEGRKIFLHIWSYLLNGMDEALNRAVRKVEYSILKEL